MQTPNAHNSNNMILNEMSTFGIVNETLSSLYARLAKCQWIIAKAYDAWWFNIMPLGVNTCMQTSLTPDSQQSDRKIENFSMIYYDLL